MNFLVPMPTVRASVSASGLSPETWLVYERTLGMGVAVQCVIQTKTPLRSKGTLHTPGGQV